MKEAECYPGKKVGRLTLIEKRRIPSGKWTQGGWLCHCDCGNETVVRTYTLGLEKGKTQSCGCLKRESVIKRNTLYDGDSKKGSKYYRLYTAWCNMKSRCYAEYNTDYENYGARGICVCPEWRDSYENFKTWALDNGFDYTKSGIEQSIDRIDVNGNYEPENCRWVDLQVQAGNKTTNTYIWINGKRYTQQELAREYNINHKTIAYRVNQGWNDEDIIGKAYQNLDTSRQKIATINGETKTLVEWSKISGVKIITMRNRYAKGVRGEDLIKPADQSLNRHKNIAKILVNGESLTFAELSEKTDLNEKTLRERYAKGLRDDDLIAPPGKAPRITKRKEETIV